MQYGAAGAPDKTADLSTDVNVVVRFPDESLTACAVEEIPATAPQATPIVDVDGPLQQVSPQHGGDQFATSTLIRHKHPRRPSLAPSLHLRRIPHREVFL